MSDADRSAVFNRDILRNPKVTLDLDNFVVERFLDLTGDLGIRGRDSAPDVMPSVGRR